ncbi:hypothetical protein B0H10DRAFT_2186982 [Mycena sp. CBHHK59/15]|nr:hypothetical protein B0H10DRAFT_2186982 [Mycena sp. CBHHK59/15]
MPLRKRPRCVDSDMTHVSDSKPEREACRLNNAHSSSSDSSAPDTPPTERTPLSALSNTVFTERKEKTCSEASQDLSSPVYLATAWDSLRVTLLYIATACQRLEGVAEWLATTRKPSQGLKLIQVVAISPFFSGSHFAHKTHRLQPHPRDLTVLTKSSSFKPHVIQIVPTSNSFLLAWRGLTMCYTETEQMVKSRLQFAVPVYQPRNVLGDGEFGSGGWLLSYSATVVLFHRIYVFFVPYDVKDAKDESAVLLMSLPIIPSFLLSFYPPKCGLENADRPPRTERMHPVRARIVMAQDHDGGGLLGCRQWQAKSGPGRGDHGPRRQLSP